MNPVLLIDVVGLTTRLLGDETPHLCAFAEAGAAAPMGAVLPAVTCSAQATLLTGEMPVVHGAVAAADAERAAAALFAGAADADSVPASDLPADALVGEGLPLVQALADCGLLKSKGEARRMVRQKAVRINGYQVTDELLRLTSEHVRDGRIALQVGKKKHHHLRVAL